MAQIGRTTASGLRLLVTDAVTINNVGYLQLTISANMLHAISFGCSFSFLLLLSCSLQ